MIHTPGHSSEHHVVWDAERQKTIFGGDLYLGVKVRVTHPWPREDVRGQIASIRRVIALKPKRYFDAHRGLVTDAIAQLAATAGGPKRPWARSIRWSAKGMSDDEIVQVDLRRRGQVERDHSLRLLAPQLRRVRSRHACRVSATGDSFTVSARRADGELHQEMCVGLRPRPLP